MSLTVLLVAGAAGFVGAAVGGQRILVDAPIAAPPRVPSLGSSLRGRLTYRRRERQMSEQLPDTIGTIADALRSGRSLPEALTFAADEGGPLAPQLQHVVDAIEDGLPTDAALKLWADQRGADRSVGLLVAVLSLQRRTGGDIPTILEGVVRTVTDRVHAVREVGSLTAQARLSAVVIVLLPIGFLGFVGLTSPDDLVTSIGSPLGLAALVVGLALDGVAFLWMRSILRVRL